VMLLGLSLGFFVVYGLRPPEVILSSSGPAEFTMRVRNRDSVTTRRTGTIKLTRRALDGRMDAYASIHYYAPYRKLTPAARFELNKRAWFNECGPKVDFLDNPKVSPSGTRIEQRYQNPCSGHYGLLRLIILDGQDALMLDVYRPGKSTDGGPLPPQVGARSVPTWTICNRVYVRRSRDDGYCCGYRRIMNALDGILEPGCRGNAFGASLGPALADPPVHLQGNA